MRLRFQVVPAAMLAAGVVAGAAHAGFVLADMGKFAQANGAVSPAATGPCWWRKGRRVCSVGRGTLEGAHVPRDYYEHDANKLPFGTERWRDQMRRENRLGNPG
jgi:hypothetical protein